MVEPQQSGTWGGVFGGQNLTCCCCVRRFLFFVSFGFSTMRPFRQQEEMICGENFLPGRGGFTRLILYWLTRLTLTL